MRKLLVRVLCSTALLSVLHSPRLAAQSTIAHWSFDLDSVALDNFGILSAVDGTGFHNAMRTSAATGVRPINSVPGQFGGAAEFTNVIGEDAGGASRLQIPNLFEIMGPTAGSFTFAAWAKTSAVGQDNTILSDWVTTNTYWFLLDNASSTDSRPRGQIRNQSGGDIIAATITAAEAGQASMADDQWHHYVWMWDKPAATMTWYIDGVQRATRTSGQSGSGLDLRTSSNANAHIGWKQDSNDHFSGTLDELWVFNGALTQQQINTLRLSNTPPEQMPVNALSLQVDPFNGLIVLKNGTSSPITFSSYRITSATGALNVSAWNPISNGNEHQDQFPVGFGDGEGWEIAPNGSNHEIVEWYLTGASTLSPGQRFNLGHAFNPAGAQNLQFQYTLADDTIQNGQVFYVGIPLAPPEGDYNNNGIVDAADYVVWRKNVGTMNPLPNDPIGGEIGAAHYNLWRSNFGKPATPHDAIGSAAAVPEPGASLLAFIAWIAGGWLRSRLRRAPNAANNRALAIA